jgi:hypothetical protein
LEQSPYHRIAGVVDTGFPDDRFLAFDEIEIRRERGDRVGGAIVWQVVPEDYLEAVDVDFARSLRGEPEIQ